MTGRSQTYDLVVVGAGPVGLATAVEAARRGSRVLVLEQFDLFTQLGSSGGTERQWRLQYSEEDLARLTLEAVPLWQGLEAAGNRRLLHRTGSLWFGDTAEATNEGAIGLAVNVLDRIGVEYEWLTAREIEARFPFTELPARFEGFYQADGGMIDVQGTRWVLHALAVTAGAEIRTGERVVEIAPDGSGVTVRSTSGSVRAEHVVVAAGPFARPLLEPLGVRLELELFELSTISFRLRDPGSDLPTWFAFQKPTEEDINLFYGFGRNPWSGSDLVRAGPSFEDDHVGDPYQARHSAHERHVARAAEWIGRHLPALDPRPQQTGSGLAALPADPGRQFYFGQLPASVPHRERVVVFSSGWCFKFVPLLGRACAELALTGATSFDLARFGLD
jgi:sarcosine oxidase